MIEGVVRAPSEFSITRVLLPSMIATHELVVPRSMPMIFAIAEFPLNLVCGAANAADVRYLGSAADGSSVCSLVA
jgi:hypothetical protein